MLPQIIYLVLLFTGLLLEAKRHGKPRTGNYSFWTSFIAIAIQFGIMYWGGFFNGIF